MGELIQGNFGGKEGVRQELPSDFFAGIKNFETLVQKLEALSKGPRIVTAHLL